MESNTVDMKFGSAIGHIKQVCLDLIAEEKREIVLEIINFYYRRAKTILDFDVLGDLAIKAEDRPLYLKCAEHAYFLAKSTEELYIARNNLHKALSANNYPDKALFYIDINLGYNPNDFDNNLNKAFNIALMGNRDESESIIENLIAQNPKDEENIKFSLSGKMLRKGQTATGILNFIDTFKPRNTLFEDSFKMQKWTGIPQPGRKIYVNGEGGIGDEIINIRFLKNLEELGMEPILYSSWNMYRPDLVDVFRRHGYKVLCEFYSIDTNELWTNLMPLPGYLGLKEKDLWKGQYLWPSKNPKNNLNSKKFKIGIKCNGNPYFSQDIYRRIPIDQMLKYLPTDNKNVEIYLIDKEKTHEKCINLKDKLNSWEDTLDFVDQMDLIVSGCTSLIHAAGAMDKRSIVLVPIAEYYTWTSTRKDGTTPWYSERMTVVKQNKIRDWDGPLSKVKEIIEGMLST